MARSVGSIAKELEKRLWTLADPAVEWVQGTPKTQAQACLVLDGRPPEYALSMVTRNWLSAFVLDYAAWVDMARGGGVLGPGVVSFNDTYGRTRQEVLWMLEEAVDQAKWEGV